MPPFNDNSGQDPHPDSGVIGMLTLEQLGVLLVKHNHIHEGVYNISMEFQIGVGAVGPNPESTLPGAMVGVSRIGLTRAEAPGAHSIDAAIVNPAKKPRKQKTSQ